MERKTVEEFLRDVIQEIDDLPEGLRDRLLELAVRPTGARPAELRRLFEEVTRD